VWGRFLSGAEPSSIHSWFDHQVSVGIERYRLGLAGNLPCPQEFSKMLEFLRGATVYQGQGGATAVIADNT